MCASSNWSSVRTSTTSAPSEQAWSTWRGVSGWTSGALARTSGPRLSATMFSKLGGCGRSAAVARRMNSSSSSDREQRASARARTRSSTTPSCPSPDRRTASRPCAPARPRRCRAGRAAARAASGRSVGRPRPCRRPGRAGRCPPRTASRRSAPPTARRRARRRSARTRCARAGGRACAARALARCRGRAPSRRRTARGRSRARHRDGCGWSAPVAAARRPWPDTWSAWLWVSRMWSICTPV